MLSVCVNIFILSEVVITGSVTSILCIEIDKNVSIISPIPLPGIGLSNILPRMLKFKKISVNSLNEYIIIDRQQFDKKFDHINTQLIKKYGKNFIPIYEDLCDDDNCYFGNLEGLFFSDSHHLSQKSVNILIKTNKIIRKVKKSKES